MESDLFLIHGCILILIMFLQSIESGGFRNLSSKILVKEFPGKHRRIFSRYITEVKIQITLHQSNNIF